MKISEILKNVEQRKPIGAKELKPAVPNEDEKLVDFGTERPQSTTYVGRRMQEIKGLNTITVHKIP